MANQNPNGKLTYWYEGVQSTLITTTPSSPIGAESYWYYGGPQGFLIDSVIIVKPRNFAILIGF